jgi:hypothetical protein
MLDKMKEFAPDAFDEWKKYPEFDWGERPKELIGKTTMKPVYKEYPYSY